LQEIDDLIEKARKIHQQAWVFDAHCDTICKIVNEHYSLEERKKIGHLDIPRMKEGGIGVQIFAVFIEDIYKPDRSLKRALQLISSLYQEIEQNHLHISLVYNFNQLKEARRMGKIAAILSIEGGEVLEGELGILGILYTLGVRLLTLTWNQRNQIADGVGESRTGGGLTNFGIEVIEQMNKLGMIIDVSHLSEKGFWEVVKKSKAPIIASHSNCYSLCPHPRNLKDDQLRAIAKKGGVIGINFVPNFLTKKRRKVTIQEVINHIDYLVENIGIDYVGLGSDFDGTKKLPVGLEGAEKYPYITIELLKRGYEEEEIQKILGGNLVRVFKEVVG